MVIELLVRLGVLALEGECAGEGYGKDGDEYPENSGHFEGVLCL